MFGALDNGQLDMPDYEHMEDEAFPLVPPPLSPGGGDLEGNALADGEGEVSKLPEVPAAKRRTVKRPQPKLDSQRLLSERGLPALRTLFDNVKFKGKGHESEDLKVLLQKMENWAHRLYPKLQFEDFIDKLEVLGGKKEVQTCLKRIRLDMPLTHEDFVGQNDDEADGRLQEDTDPFGDGGFSEDPFVHSTPAPAPAPAPAPLSLTEEQHKRIELNKQLALERRLARQKQQDESVGSPGHHLSQDNQEDLDRNAGTNSSPLKHNPSLPENSHLRDECESPIPELTSRPGENAD